MIKRLKIFSILLLIGVLSCNHNNNGPALLEKAEREILGFSDGENPRIKEIQQVLIQNGFLRGSEDGRINLSTRRAIREFQSQQKLEVTGYVDSITLRDINRLRKIEQKNRIIIETYPGAPGPELPAPVIYQRNVVSTSVSEQIDEKLENFKLPAEIDPEILRIQKALQKAGFYQGTLDGKSGLKTQKALMNFQKSRNLKPDGMIRKETLEVLSPFME